MVAPAYLASSKLRPLVPPAAGESIREDFAAHDSILSNATHELLGRALLLGASQWGGLGATRDGVSGDGVVGTGA